jgi:acyl-CoA thioester hydrolase
MAEPATIGLTVAEGIVRPEWIDYNGHMNVAYYVLAFDYAIDALWARIGITDEYIRETRGSTFAVETHVTYQQELQEAEPYIVTMELLAYDAKRIHHFQRMYHAEKSYLAATAEWMSLHVDLNIRRVSPWPDNVLARLAEIAAQQENGHTPDEAGSRMKVNQPIYALAKDAQCD